MRKPKHLIFDCDGVLINSEIIANRIEADVKTELGFPITLEEQLTKFVGLGHSSPLVVEEMRRLPPDYKKIFQERLAKAYDTDLKALPGVEELLASLPHAKCVASSSQGPWLRHKLQLTKLNHFFGEAVYSASDVTRLKPHPDLFLHAMKTQGWKVEDCLVVEDSVPGVEAGKAAGLIVCAFLGGEHIVPDHAAKVLAAGADYVVNDIRNVRRLLADLA
jgi:haloacid dehalogenase superfamily, subfamily IA, variant 3 with third motif having DD or ED